MLKYLHIITILLVIGKFTPYAILNTVPWLVVLAPTFIALLPVFMFIAFFAVSGISLVWTVWSDKRRQSRRYH